MDKAHSASSLLAGLSPVSRELIMGAASPFEFAAETSLLNQAGGQACLLIEHGLASLHVTIGKRLSGSVGLVGRGGMIGVPALLGFDAPLHQAVAVTAVGGVAIPPGHLRSCLVQLGDFRRLVASYVSLRFTQALVHSACNLEHGLSPRLADWIGLAAELAGDTLIQVTHERLAVILGATRPSVTLALQSLEEQKAIRSRRGQVEILDAERLRHLACGCGRSPLGAASGKPVVT